MEGGQQGAQAGMQAGVQAGVQGWTAPPPPKNLRSLRIPLGDLSRDSTMVGLQQGPSRAPQAPLARRLGGPLRRGKPGLCRRQPAHTLLPVVYRSQSAFAMRGTGFSMVVGTISIPAEPCCPVPSSLCVAERKGYLYFACRYLHLRSCGGGSLSVTRRGAP
jgi:hypothetical protein